MKKIILLFFTCMFSFLNAMERVDDSLQLKRQFHALERHIRLHELRIFELQKQVTKVLGKQNQYMTLLNDLAKQGKKNPLFQARLEMWFDEERKLRQLIKDTEKQVLLEEIRQNEVRDRLNRLKKAKRERLLLQYKEFIATYPVLASELLPGYEIELLHVLKQIDPAILRKANTDHGKSSELIWRIINNVHYLGVTNIKDREAGYVFFYPKEATGKVTGYTLEDLPALSARKAADPVAREKLSHIAGNYKIHLMPHRQFVPEIVILLIKALKQDPTLGLLMASFKIKYKSGTLHTIGLKKQPQEERMPRIVIYPAEGKEQVQRLLDKIIMLFKDQVDKGIGIGPRWNQKVNNLIYFAQGDGDAKKEPTFAQYFEQPNMIYYHPFFTGVYKDYHLRF